MFPYDVAQPPLHIEYGLYHIEKNHFFLFLLFLKKFL